MLPKFVTFAPVVFVAGVFAPFGSSCAVRDSHPFDAFRLHVIRHWIPPAEVSNPEEVIVRVRLSLNPDGTLAGPPKVVTVGTTERYAKAREAAIRAIYRAQPFTMLLPVNYDLWKEIEITFDPREAPRR